jgi:Hint domain
MAVTTYTWTAGTSGDWSVKTDWTPNGTPGTGTGAGTDVVDLNSGSYTVTVASTDPILNVGTINLTGSVTQGSSTLQVGGTLTTGAVDYTASSTKQTPINVVGGGLFDITGNITDSGSTTETINIGTTISPGGHVVLGSGTVTSNVYFSFGNSSSGPSTNELEFSSYGTIESDNITNFGWGDKLVFDGASFAGDTASYNSSNETLTVKNSIGASVLTITNITGPNALTTADIVLSGDQISVKCFAARTRILTPLGERTVESLEPGESVLTLSAGHLKEQPIKWIGRRRIDLKGHPRPETVAPVRIRRGAFADNTPRTDLLLSPDHAIFVDGKLICARQLINGNTIRQELTWPTIEYFHVELPTHAILLSNGLPTESYLETGNRGFFANSGEPLMLHPNLTDEADYPTRAAGSCAPFVWDEPNVRPVWERLAARAGELGRPVPRAAATTTDPDLRIAVRGQIVRPIYAENGLHIFALPKGAREVHLMSRASSPTAARPWMEDRRLLGVYVERIAIRSAHEVRAIPLDYPGLTQGWWAVEQNGTEQRRWTDGGAVVPLPALRGPAMLEITASSSGMVYVPSSGAPSRPDLSRKGGEVKAA